MDFGGRTVFPLSQSQLNIWNLEQAYPGTSINHISTTVTIRGKIDFVLLQRSITMLLEADATLRTRITLQGDKPVQFFALIKNRLLTSMIFPIQIRRESPVGRRR